MRRDQRQETRQSILFMCRLTFKSLTIGLILTYGLVFALLAIKPAEAATLKPEAIISGNVVHVSDLFDDITQKQDAVIGQAPSPGQSVILNARTLTRIATVYGLKWEATSPAEQIVVKSLIQTISTDEIASIIKKDLEARGVSGKFTVSLNNVAPTISLPADVAPTAEIAQMSYTAGRDVFTAVIAAPSAANPLKTLTVSGLIEKTVSVPVLKSAVTAGDIIGSTDIEWIDVAARHMVNDTIVDADNLMGKTPVRMVDANTPVRARDVKAPQLVARGDEVLLQFNQGGLTLTAKGKAMQNGAEGDVIRVMNLSSNQSLRGAVIGDKAVAVQ